MIKKFEQYVKKPLNEANSDFSDEFTKRVKDFFEENGFYDCGAFYVDDDQIKVVANTPLNLKDIWSDNLDDTIEKLNFIKEMNKLSNSYKEICIPDAMKRVMYYWFDVETLKNII